MGDWVRDPEIQWFGALGISRSRTRPSSCSPAAFHVAILQLIPRWSDPSPSEVTGPAAGEWASPSSLWEPSGGQDAERRREMKPRAPLGEKGAELSSPPLALAGFHCHPLLPTPPTLHLPRIFPPSFAPSTAPSHHHGDKRGGGVGCAPYFESLHNSPFLWRHRGCLWN